MEDTKNTLVNESPVLKGYAELLKKEVNTLEVRKSNLESQVLEAERRLEATKKIDNIGELREVTEYEKKLKNLESLLKSKEEIFQMKENEYENRVKIIEKREQELIDLEDRKKQLNHERHNFYFYKTSVEADLNKAHNTIMEAHEVNKQIEADKNSLVVRERRIAELEKYWNDKIGELEIDRKRLQLEIENTKGIAEFKEEVNDTNKDSGNRLE